MKFNIVYFVSSQYDEAMTEKKDVVICKFSNELKEAPNTNIIRQRIHCQYANCFAAKYSFISWFTEEIESIVFSINKQ